MTVDEYLAKLEPAQKAALERIRQLVKKAVPAAEEKISYGIPTMTYKGKYLIYFAAYPKHLSIYGGLTKFEDKLGDYKLSHKGTLQFTPDKPVPDSLLKEIILARKAELDS